MAKVLVVGGAGYVGSAATAWLLEKGHEPWILDDLSTGRRQLALGDGFTRAQAGDSKAVAKLLASKRFDCAWHFAAKASVAESVARPELYYENNVVQTRKLLDALLEAGVTRFVFSSTCAIFGDPGDRALNEDHPKHPINPYGRTKLEAESLLAEYAERRGLRAIALRYFNAAGAEPGLRVGEWHEPETHLIPIVLRAALEGGEVSVFGQDYPTPDGTCVRDYVHVTDLARAHGAAMERLLRVPGEEGLFEAYNLGSEHGYSVLEIVEACRRVTGKPVRMAVKDRRPGDPPKLVADSSRARKTLGFSPRRDALEEIIRSAWDWERKKRSLSRAVFLDRDGTINEDPGYLSDPSQMKLLPGVGEALARLSRAGFKLVVVSNQSGVGRGLIDERAIPAIHARLGELLGEHGARIDHYELCFHRPEDACACRKPEPKLLVDAARAVGADLSKSFMVGDKRSDLEAGRAAGCGGVGLVRTGYGRETEATVSPGAADFAGDSLGDVADWILGS